ncbi:jg1380, partial [Pararge aegeria aegeria]
IIDLKESTQVVGALAAGITSRYEFRNFVGGTKTEILEIGEQQRSSH